VVAARIGKVPGQELPELQHSKKFVEEVRPTEMRQSPVIAGDEQISRWSTHSDPYL